MSKENFGIIILHLQTGENIIADVTMTEEHYVCRNPLSVWTEAAGLNSLSFTSVIPLFTGETIFIPTDRVVYIVKPHSLVAKCYQDQVDDFIDKNRSAIVTYNQYIDKTKKEIKRTLN